MRILLASGPGWAWDKPSGDVMVKLARQLEAGGHQVDHCKLPMKIEVERMLDQVLAIRLLNLEESSDCLISLGAPAHLLRHQQKHVWLPAGGRLLASQVPAKRWNQGLGAEYLAAIQAQLRNADNMGLMEAQTICCRDRITGTRLRRLYGRRVRILTESRRAWSPSGASSVDCLLRQLASCLVPRGKRNVA